MKVFKMTWMALLIACLSLAAFGQRITVTSPAGGENWALGDTVAITWTATGVSGSVRVSLTNRGGAMIGTIAGSLRAAAGRHTWTAGELTSGTAAIGENYRIRVHAIDSDTFGESATFDIVARASRPSLRLQPPNGGERWALGQPQMISWESTGLPASTRVKLELYRDGLSAARRVGVISSDRPVGPGDPPGAGLLWWNGGDLAGGARAAVGSNCYYIRVATMDDSVFDFSDAPFSLVLPALVPLTPSITVSTPRSALTLTHLFTINWVARNVTGNVVINLLRESGGVFTLAAGVDPGLAFGSFTWTIGQLANPAGAFPAVAGERFRIQVGGRGVLGRSGWFEIVSPGLSISEPDSEWLSRGDSKTIRWNAPDIQGFVHIEAHYRRSPSNPPVRYTQLFSNVPNLGHRDWTVFPLPRRGVSEINPPPTGFAARWFIRIISVRCPWIYADSATFFIR